MTPILHLATDREPCSEQEKLDLLAYLWANSHVRLPIQLLQAGWSLEQGKVKGPANIGQMRTCFTNLGNTYSQKLHGTKFFCVAQALSVFSNPGDDKHPDIQQGFQKILRYRDQFAMPDSSPMVTIVEIPEGMLIADGGKTAIAGYLYSEEAGLKNFALPVYYVAPAPRAGS